MYLGHKLHICQCCCLANTSSLHCLQRRTLSHVTYENKTYIEQVVSHV